jgi:alpha-L-rhamnosidase
VDSDADGVPSGRVSQQSNALCLLYDIATPAKLSGILSYIFDPQRVMTPEKHLPAHADFDNRKDVVQAQPYFMHWVNAALAHVGDYERIVELDRTLWGKMIDAGATTIWETWSREASECHSWAATPAYDMMTYVLGMRGVTPGFGQLVIEPHPTQLEWARGVSPSVKGDISVSWHSAAGEFQIEGTLPEASAASVLIPPQGGKNARQAHLNGQPVWRENRPVGLMVAKAEAGGVRIQLRKGERYKIEARY